MPRRFNVTFTQNEAVQLNDYALAPHLKLLDCGGGDQIICVNLNETTRSCKASAFSGFLSILRRAECLWGLWEQGRGGSRALSGRDCGKVGRSHSHLRSSLRFPRRAKFTQPFVPALPKIRGADITRVLSRLPLLLSDTDAVPGAPRGGGGGLGTGARGGWEPEIHTGGRGGQLP